MNGRYNSLITAKNVGIVTILCAATATVIILNQPKLKSKNKKNKRKKRKLAVALNPTELSSLQHDLESRRQKILNEFEECGHKKIPEEMHKAIDFIVNDLEPSLYPPSIRLLASQLIQDYAIMYTNINTAEPDPAVILLAKEWLDFECADNNSLKIEQINHRYALALRSRSIKEFKFLFNWLQSMDANIREQESIRQNWILRCFQCSCLLGKWKDVKAFGLELEKVEPESLATNGQQQAPLHPLHLFEYIALKLPNQSANFTQVYYNVDRYIKTFDPRLSPPLKFTEWSIKSCSTMISFGFSTNPKRNEELIKQIQNAQQNGNKLNPVPSTSRYMFIYGVLVQFPCFWVQLPASNTKMQPVVLTGPWNDSEMELTASYIRRVPQSEKEKNGKNEHNEKGRLIRVVRSDLKLKLDRRSPYNSNDENKNDEVEAKQESTSSSSSSKNKKSSQKNGGWNWKGEFEHEEGLLECYESDLNNFKFRRYRGWKMNAIKFTCRTWQIHMVINSPD
eukprot:80120_1